MKILRSAPALELNLVAVTTLRFRGSTAPTATSGVSTSATIRGGAVRIAARPNRTGKSGVSGVPVRGDGLIGVVGVRGDRPEPLTLTLSRLLEAGVGAAREVLRAGVEKLEAEEVERAREETVRDRGCAVVETGECAVSAGAAMETGIGLSSSPSCPGDAG